MPPTFKLTEETSGTTLLVTPLAPPADDPQFMSRDNVSLEHPAGETPAVLR